MQEILSEEKKLPSNGNNELKEIYARLEKMSTEEIEKELENIKDIPSSENNKNIIQCCKITLHNREIDKIGNEKKSEIQKDPSVPFYYNKPQKNNNPAPAVTSLASEMPTPPKTNGMLTVFWGNYKGYIASAVILAGIASSYSIVDAHRTKQALEASLIQGNERIPYEKEKEFEEKKKEFELRAEERWDTLGKERNLIFKNQPTSYKERNALAEISAQLGFKSFAISIQDIIKYNKESLEFVGDSILPDKYAGAPPYGRKYKNPKHQTFDRMMGSWLKKAEAFFDSGVDVNNLTEKQNNALQKLKDEAMQNLDQMSEFFNKDYKPTAGKIKYTPDINTFSSQPDKKALSFFEEQRTTVNINRTLKKQHTPDI